MKKLYKLQLVNDDYFEYREIGGDTFKEIKDTFITCLYDDKNYRYRVPEDMLYLLKGVYNIDSLTQTDKYSFSHRLTANWNYHLKKQFQSSVNRQCVGYKEELKRYYDSEIENQKSKYEDIIKEQREEINSLEAKLQEVEIKNGSLKGRIERLEQSEANLYNLLQEKPEPEPELPPPEPPPKPAFMENRSEGKKPRIKKDILIKLKEAGLTDEKIASIYGLTRQSVINAKKQYDIKKKPKRRK